jgi:hypothetical protein
MVIGIISVIYANLSRLKRCRKRYEGMTVGRIVRWRLGADVNLIGGLEANQLRWALKNTEFYSPLWAI